MNQGLRNTEELLPLTCAIKDKAAILFWRPFKQGNTLGEIVTAHNLRCDGGLQEKTPRAFVDCLPEIKPALIIGLYLPEKASDMREERLRRVKIVLVGLDGDKRTTLHLDPLKQQLATSRHLVHLVQVSQRMRPVSWTSAFEEIPNVLSTKPEIFTRQSELERFLHRFRESYENGWAGVVRNPLDATCLERAYNEPYIHPSRGHFLNPKSKGGKSVERVYRAYRKQLPRLLSGIRDAALARQLHEEQTVNLGRAAAIQELLLCFVAEKWRPIPGYPLSIDPIRLSLLEIPADRPLEMNTVQKTRLIGLRLVRLIQDLSEHELEILAALGISAKALTVIHYDSHVVREKAKELGGILKSEPFTAALPDWPSRHKESQVSLNEVCFGLKNEESRLRKTEVQYARLTNKPGVVTDTD